MKGKIIFVLGVSCFLGFLNGLVIAAENEDSDTLDTVVVTGTRTERVAERIPANITVINDEDIKNSNAKNVVDLLKTEEGIVVRDLLGNGKNAQVDLRGYGETAAYNTLVLVDGRRVNEIDLSGVDWTQIPIEQIERIEVVRGTGSVLYGDNAVGGVINIITKVPLEETAFALGETIGSYGRNKTKLSVSGGKDNLSGLLYASYDATDGYRDNNHFRTRDVGAKILFDPTDFLSLNLSGSYHSDDFGLPGPLTEEEIEDDRKATTRPSDEGESTDRYIKAGIELNFGNHGSLVTDFAYRNREIESTFVSFASAAESDIETWSITPRYVWDGDIFNHRNTLIAGMDFYWTDQDGESFFGEPLEKSGLTDIKRQSYGYYLNDEFELIQNLILSLGARREKVEYDIKQKDLLFGFAPLDDSISEWESAYSAGLTFVYSGKSSVFMRANRSFRFPLTDELVVFDFFNGNIVVNTDLEPQAGNHYELGVKHFFTPKIHGRVTLFRAEIDDEIFFNPSTFANENHPETLRQGFELGFRGDFYDRVTLFGNYTYTEATFEKDPFEDNHVPAVPKNKVTVGVRVYDVYPGLAFAAEYNYVGDSYAISDLANEYEKLDDYYTVDAKVSYEWKKFKVFFGVNNITDEEYSEYAAIGGFPTALNLYPAPERTWLTGLEMTF